MQEAPNRLSFVAGRTGRMVSGTDNSCYFSLAAGAISVGGITIPGVSRTVVSASAS